VFRVCIEWDEREQCIIVRVTKLLGCTRYLIKFATLVILTILNDVRNNIWGEFKCFTT
jgi:hypothetical protein